jgi:hypothetical protein
LRIRGTANVRTLFKPQAAFEAIAIALTLAVLLLWLRRLACLFSEQQTPYLLETTSHSVSPPRTLSLTLILTLSLILTYP